ncbi:CNH domain-containing protein [Roridomyces roridus]|uniref:CNH domain-containing protein n=1 Tax=Roridomyces roridus TaxID=1738132 RepID=A0AAD7BMI9_9AGAR|nr:CNH domain-containing protein [Roridomyces roridus]
MPSFPFVSSKPSSRWNFLRNTTKSGGFANPGSAMLPRHITDQISTELYERIIEQLVPDTQSLVACNLVCRSWAPRSRCLLLESTVTQDSGRRITCAARSSEAVIYATADGIYRDDAERPAMLREVTQMEILADVNLFLCIAGGTFITMPFDALKPGSSLDSGHVRRISKHVMCFTVFQSTEGHRVCVLKTSALSSTVKIFDVAGDQTLNLSREFYLPREALLPAQFLSRSRVVVPLKGLPRGFEMVDLTSLQTQSLLNDDPAWMALAKKTKPMSMFRFRTNLIFVCFDKVGFYVDRQGNMARHDLVLRWDSTPSFFALREPYILAFSDMRITVWNIKTAEIVQRIHGPYHSLNVPQLDGSVLVGNQDVAELVFH